MPLLRSLLRKLVALPFLCRNMEDYGLVRGLRNGQGVKQCPQIVTVNRPDVSQAQLFKEHAAHKKTLYGFFQAIVARTQPAHLEPGGGVLN